MRKRTLCLDFDGVCNIYISGYEGPTVISDPPVPGLFEFLEQAVEKFEVHIYSSRSGHEGGIEAMQEWLEIWWREYHKPHHPDEHNRGLYEYLDMIEWPITKPPAFVSIDDRAITFTGEWPDVEELQNFKPWNKK